MARTTGTDFRRVLDDLGRAIRQLRRDCPPVETARLLLSYDGPGQRLVGLRRDGERVVYFETGGRRAIATGFDASGPDDRRGRPIGTLPPGGAAADWADRMHYYWGWRHPRFR